MHFIRQGDTIDEVSHLLHLWFVTLLGYDESKSKRNLIEQCTKTHNRKISLIDQFIRISFGKAGRKTEDMSGVYHK